MNRSFVTGLGLALGLMLSPLAQAQALPEAPSYRYGAAKPIPNQYIVVFKDDVAQPAALAAQLARQSGGQLVHVYGAALKGFAARLSAAAVSALAKNPNVAYIEQDATVSLNEALISPTAAQSGATWGLDRIDQRALPLNSSYRYEYMGKGVYAFVIDTGIRATHIDFGGRVQPGLGYTAIADTYGTGDCNGHGTHVAGTLGGASFGVAKAVTLVPVRVLDCSGSGSTSGVIAGVDFVANASGQRPAVANMSLGGGYSSSLNKAVAGAVSKGVSMVVAAGNSSADACTSSPASEPSAITVGATTSSDAKASYSNFGSCLDLFAPGSSIASTWYSSDTATATLSGTSMASPHAAGVAALLLAAGAATPAAVANAMTTNATVNVVGSAGTGSPNRLLFSLASEATARLQTVAVSALSGAGKKVNPKNWQATASVTVKSFDGTNFGSGVAGAVVAGTFSNGGSASCTTSSTGSCSLTSSNISSGTASTTFIVSKISGSNLSYDSSKNVATSVVINRP